MKSWSPYRDTGLGESADEFISLGDLLTEASHKFVVSDPFGYGRFVAHSVRPYVQVFESSFETTQEFHADVAQSPGLCLTLLHEGRWISDVDGQETEIGTTATPILIGYGETVRTRTYQPRGCRIRSVSLLIGSEFCLEADDGRMSVIADLMRPGISRREIPVDHALTYILKAMTINPFHGSIAAMYRESQALSAIVALSTLSPVDRPRVGGSRSHRDLAHATREILDRNLSSPPTINALARMLGTNDTTLRRAFRQTFDMTILRYAIHRRLEVARILLNQSDLQISEIAYRMGYNDPANFTTAYRQHFGHPPSTDRQKS